MKGLYVHIPFCVRKCRYCDFYSVTDSLNTVKACIDAVIREAGQYNGMLFDTIYFGGGTPSLLGLNLPDLVTGLRTVFDLSSVKEFSIEVNPESATRAFLESAKSAGINRISIGVQSLNDAELQSVGRIHNASQAIRTIETVKQLGFDAVSVDLIAGLPGQTWLTLYRTLETLMHIGIDHVSLYCLALEEGTPLAENPPSNLPTDDTQAELFTFASKYLEYHGFSHYEISNFARSGFECKHNLIYWHNGDYLGLGPAAASHLGGIRFRNNPDLTEYLKNPCRQKQDVENLGPKDKIAEEVMVRLRLLDEGVSIDDLSARYDEDIMQAMKTKLEEMATRGLLNVDGSRYTLPPSRILTSNPVFAEILGE